MSESKTAVLQSQTIREVFLKAWCSVLILLYINDMHRSPNKMRFVHFKDDRRVLYPAVTLTNRELVRVDNWLKAKRIRSTFVKLHS